MLVRQCDRCGRPLTGDPYWKFDKTHYKPNGCFSYNDKFDLCKSCYKKLEEFLNDGGKE